jgi:hypothetical protein
MQVKKGRWQESRRVLAIAILVAAMCLAGCSKVTPTPTVDKSKVVQVQVTSMVKRETPEVWAGNAEPLPKLPNSSWSGLDPGGQVTTDHMGEAKLDIDGCMYIYVFLDSAQLVRRGCRKDAAISGSTSCSVQGTSTYNNSCASEVIIQTLSVEIQLQGTWLAVTYLPGLELSLVQVFEGQARVLPVTEVEQRKLVEEDEAIVLGPGNFAYTVPDARLAEIGQIAGLEARQRHSLERLGSFQDADSFVSQLQRLADEPNLAAWMRRTAERAEMDGIPLPPTYPRGEQVREERAGVILRGGGGPLSDPRVQDAVLSAVDWRALVEGSFEGRDVPVAVELFERDVIQDAREIPYDPDRARALLARADYPNGFGMSLFYPPGDVELQGMIKGMFDAWLDVGIRADPVELPAPDAIEKLRAGAAAGEPAMALDRQ